MISRWRLICFHLLPLLESSNVNLKCRRESIRGVTLGSFCVSICHCHCTWDTVADNSMFHRLPTALGEYLLNDPTRVRKLQAAASNLFTYGYTEAIEHVAEHFRIMDQDLVEAYTLAVNMNQLEQKFVVLRKAFPLIFIAFMIGTLITNFRCK